jgi:hypothetical protein
VRFGRARHEALELSRKGLEGFAWVGGTFSAPDGLPPAQFVAEPAAVLRELRAAVSTPAGRSRSLLL